MNAPKIEVTEVTPIYVTTPHQSIIDWLAAPCAGNTAFVIDAMEVGKAHRHLIEKPESWEDIRAAYFEDMRDKGENDQSLMAQAYDRLGKTRADNYLRLASNALIWSMVGKPTKKVIDATPFADMAEKGLVMLETGGKNGGYVDGHKVSGQRAKTLAEKGINPETGFKWEGTEKADYNARLKAKRLKAASEKAKKTSDKAATELAAHVTPENVVAHISDPDHQLQTFRSRIESAIAPKSTATPAQMVQLLTDILAAMPTPTA